IARALGQPTSPPAPPELAAMADLSMRLLRWGLPYVAPGQVDRPARIVLTGRGGGVWRIGPPAAAPEVRLVADVVQWCRMAARRASAADVAAGAVGDGGLAVDLLRAT